MTLYIALLLLTFPVAVFHVYDRRMMPVVARSILLNLVRLWLLALLTWGLQYLLWKDGPKAPYPPTPKAVATVSILLAAWAITTCTRRAMKVFHSSRATGQAQRDFLLANGATQRQAMRPFTRRALRRTVIVALREPLIPAMLLTVMVGMPAQQAALLSSLMMGIILTTSLGYILLRTQFIK